MTRERRRTSRRDHEEVILLVGGSYFASNLFRWVRFSVGELLLSAKYVRPDISAFQSSMFMSATAGARSWGGCVKTEQNIPIHSR